MFYLCAQLLLGTATISYYSSLKNVLFVCATIIRNCYNILL